jgi:hypothetical protein
MSKHLYDATIMQLKGRALEAYAALDMLFSNPSVVPDHTAWSQEIIKHTTVLAEHENVMVTLQQYFGPRYSPPAPPHGPGPTRQAPPQEEPSPITPEMSSTLRREMEKNRSAKEGKE